MLEQQNSLDKKIVTLTILILIWVFALTLISPVISKKPDNTGKKSSSDRLTNGASGIQIYWDSKGTNIVSSIDWGSLEPGTNRTVTIFIMNKGKDQLTLSYHTSNWNPSEVADYLSLKWDYNGQAIEFREMVQVIFSLVISENAEARGAFSFDITIIGSQ